MPKLRDVLRLEWKVEVGKQLKPHQGGYADGYVAITREITIKLGCETNGAKSYLKPGKTIRVLEYPVDVLTDIIGYKTFLQQSQDNEPKTDARQLRVGMMVGPELGNDGVGSGDWTAE